MNNLLKYVDKNFIMNNAEKKFKKMSAVKKEVNN